MAKNAKLYFVRFQDKQSAEVFYKFGHTYNYDVLLRFHDDRYYKDMYNKWHIKVICSAYGPDTLVKQEEEFLLSKYKKDFWIEDKIKGVKEIRKLTAQQIAETVAYFKCLSNHWYQLRHHTDTTSCASSR